MSDFVQSFRPISGFTDVPPMVAGIGSYVSGQNVWVQRGELVPRWRFESMATGNPVGANGIGGATVFYDSKGTASVIAFSASGGTVAVLNSTLDWSASSRTSSNGSVFASGHGTATQGFVGSATVYLPRIDENILMYSDNSTPIHVYQQSTLRSSVATGSPICRDLCNFDNRPVAWNIKYLSGTTRYITRVQWPVAGDPEDWTGIGSGSEDLLDMRGEGTRIFADQDQMVLATTAEIWRGRAIGLPYVFQFSPIVKSLGMPYPKAAVQTPWGLFWLGANFTVYWMRGEQIIEVGAPVQKFFASDVYEAGIHNVFFSYNPTAMTITMYYATAVSPIITRRALTYHIDSGVWTRHAFDTTADGLGFSVTLAYNVQYPTRDYIYPPAGPTS